MKLHLGCWHRYIPNFVHVDYCDMPHIDHKSTINDLSFLEDNQAELIYCSHALEYFDRIEAEKTLKEWYRVLAPGGVLRLAVPNFPKLVEVYQQSGDLNRVLGPLYGRMVIQTEEGEKTLYHKTTYDEASLMQLFIDCGFESPQWWDWRTTEHANIDDHSQAYFPHMQKETGILISLNMQASKPL